MRIIVLACMLFHSNVGKRVPSVSKHIFTNPRYVPGTVNQQTYEHYLKDPACSLLLGVGPAGCGKTLFACIAAMEKLKEGSIKKILLTRPVVPVEEDIGFLPGSLANKMEPWTRPLFDVFGEYFSTGEIKTMVNNGVIEISPLAYMRGRTFKQAFVIADEMQNSSPNQMFMLATRMGEDSKLVITGDLDQSDKGHQNGLFDLIGKYKHASPVLQNKSGIHMVQFNSTDIKRSALVSNIIELYGNKTVVEEQTFMREKTNDAAMFPKGYESKRFTL